MKALLIKDLMVLRGQAKALLAVFAVWFIISFINGSDLFFIALSVIFSILLPLTAVTADEKSGFERYAMTMPLTRFALAVSRYALGLLCCAAVTAVGVICAVVIGDEIGEALFAALACFSLGLILMSVALPLVYKFGAEKAQILMTIVFVAVFLLIGLAAERLGIEVDSLGGVTLLLPVFALAVLAASVLISLRIYAKREF